MDPFDCAMDGAVDTGSISSVGQELRMRRLKEHLQQQQQQAAPPSPPKKSIFADDGVSQMPDSVGSWGDDGNGPDGGGDRYEP